MVSKAKKLAQEYARLLDAREYFRGDDNNTLCYTDLGGGLTFYESYDPVELDAVEALRLARWIVDAFGEGLEVAPRSIPKVYPHIPPPATATPRSEAADNPTSLVNGRIIGTGGY